MSGSSGRGAYRIVARREFVERARDRGFVISTAMTLLVLVGVIVVSSLSGGPERFDVAVGGSQRALGSQIVASARALGIEVRIFDTATDESAERLVRDGRADAALLAGHQIVVRSEGDQRLLAVIQSVWNRATTEQALRDAGVSDEELTDALAQPPLPVRALEPLDAHEQQNSAVAFVAVLALYGQLFAYGYWVASGVVEEKSSRVVEVLLATIRPRQLLVGKIVGIGLLGLAQLLLVAAVGLVTAEITGALEFPSGALATVALSLVWFLFGFAFYACLFAVAGAIVSRQEDLQSAITPLSIVIVASFIIGIQAVQTPTSLVATIASLLPLSAPLSMPSRIVLGQASAWQIALSVVVSAATTVALVPLAVRLYTRAVLRAGRVRLRDIVRSGARR